MGSALSHDCPATVPHLSQALLGQIGPIEGTGRPNRVAKNKKPAWDSPRRALSD